jgi:TonB family protein
MMETLQLEETIPVRGANDGPKLLVAWTPRWEDFVTSIPAAFARSEARLAGEAPFGLIPLRIMLPSYVLEAFLIFAAIIIPIKINQLRPYVAPTIANHDVIYYSGDELPRTEDLGGAQSGKTGRAGGDESHHHTQTIRIARGGSLVPRVVDAPNLKIPESRDAVANLLAIKPNPGPPPSEGMRSARSAPNLSSSIVAPAPNAVRDYTRNGVRLDTVIAPAPSTTRDLTTAPTLSANVIPPAPNVASDHTLYAPALAPSVIPPAPKVSHDRVSSSPSLTPNVVAPAPSVSREQARSAPSLASNVIPPAPGAVSRQVSSSPVQMANVAVVPPPVSAPERTSPRDPKLTLPSPAVIAPPPSSDIARDMRHLANGSTADTSKAVVPPPPTQSGSGSLLSSLVGKIFGASEVVPPPPAVSSNGANTGSPATTLSARVVPPPPSSTGNTAAGDLRGSRNGASTALNPNVIAPPSSTGVSGGTGNRSQYSSTAQTLGAPKVVPPPPSLTTAGGGTGQTTGGTGAPSGNLLASNVVPPPPSVGGGSNTSGTGIGRKGPGSGAPLNVGSPVAPPANGGSGANSGAVISSQPGSKVGLPATSSGALALSPAGGDKSGLGGAGGGTGIGRDNGSGSGVNGAGSGAGKTDAGRGTDPNAHAGISPTPGPGGAGNANTGAPPVPGVSVNGGSSVITLPSFGDDPSGNTPSSPARSTSPKHGEQLGVTIVATVGSGGAFEPYKNLLHGETYTTYFDTPLGSVSMEFADEAAATHAFGSTLTAPQPIRTDLPQGLPRARVMIKCSLDATGNVKNVHVLEPGPAEMTAKVVAAMHNWKFQPAMRGDQPVEVTAILGFNIDTNDRF